MTAVLPPPITFQGYTQNGHLNAFGFVATYAAGTNTPIATYTDATQTQVNPNPVPLNAIGQAAIWLAPGVGYKFVETDQFGNQCGFADQINAAGAGINSNLVPSTNNVFNIGSPTFQWANGYFGTSVLINGVPAVTYPLTVAETAASVIPSVLTFPEGDIRRYGATTAAIDNSAAINAALAVSGAGGNAAFIPGGNWNITSSMIANSTTLTGPSSMYGTGQGSVIVATGCDSLSFLSGQAADSGSRFFRDFMISGSSSTTSNNNGITVNLNTGKIIGVQFSNLTVQNFAKGVFVNGATGIWNSSFTDCFLFNNYHGYYFFGQVVLPQIRGGFVIGGLTMTGTGVRYGFFSQDQLGGNLQSLHMQGVGIYNYDYLISIVNPVYVAIEDCDLSIYNICGVFIGGRTGGFAVRDCWIQAATGISNCAGVYVQDLGTTLFDKIVIDGCTLEGSTGTGTCGVYLGINAGPVSVTNNIIGSAATPFVIGVGGNGGTLGSSAIGQVGALSAGAVIENNTLYATTTAVLIQTISANISVRDNTTQNGVPIAFNAGTPTGFSYSAPGMKGTANFAGSTSVTVPVTMPNGGYFVMTSGNASGFIWVVNKTATGFVINCSGSNSNPTDWSVSYQ